MEMPMFLTMRTTTDDHAQPPHPGEFITEVYLIPNNFSGRELATQLGVAASTLSRLLKGSSGISRSARGVTKRRWRSPQSQKCHSCFLVPVPVWKRRNLRWLRHWAS